jgi:7-cyano-7-deazaguanine synthase
MFNGSALTDGGAVPKGLDYRDPGQAATVVPGRNLVFLSIAVAEAKRIGTDRVLFAAHAGDEAVYPDCRQGFVTALSCAASRGYGVRVEAPFLHMTKRQIVALGRSLNAPYGLPFELAWSCYEGGRQPCGRCGACVERAEAET